MLHAETVETRTLDLIRALMQDTKLQVFFLVGGTALSIKLKHRMSIRDTPFHREVGILLCRVLSDQDNN
jgi:hypothetical protein